MTTTSPIANWPDGVVSGLNALLANNLALHVLQDNQSLTAEMKTHHALCDETGDIATASLLEDWIDEADGRAWFLLEAQ
jgi:hypothetical protein